MMEKYRSSCETSEQSESTIFSKAGIQLCSLLSGNPARGMSQPKHHLISRDAFGTSAAPRFRIDVINADETGDEPLSESRRWLETKGGRLILSSAIADGCGVCNRFLKSGRAAPSPIARCHSPPPGCYSGPR